MKHQFRTASLAIALTATLFSANASLPPSVDGHYLTMFPTKWHMVDALVNKQIKAKVGWGLESWKRRFMHIGLAALPGIIAGCAATFMDSGKLKNTLTDMSAVIPTSLVLPIGYNFYHRWGKIDHEEQERLDLIMSRWQELRPYFPQELYRAFDAVYQLREVASPDYTANATRAFRLAQQLASNKVSEHDRPLKWFYLNLGALANQANKVHKN